MKTNNTKCKLNNSQYPNCCCNECYDNVIEFDGISIGDYFVYQGYYSYLNNKDIKIKKILPNWGKNKEGIYFVISNEGQAEWASKNELVN
jgi:hypothetical protein